MRRPSQPTTRRARFFERKALNRPAAASLVARPGAAKSLPLRLASRLPVLGRFARQRLALEPAAPPSLAARWRARLSPRGLLQRMRRPLASTARMVEAAREVRRPRTRWERVRQAAQQALDDPRDSLRWESLMGLGVALAAGKGRGSPLLPEARLRIARMLPAALKPAAPQAPAPGLGTRLLRRWMADKQNAGRGDARDRRSRR